MHVLRKALLHKCRECHQLTALHAGSFSGRVAMPKIMPSPCRPYSVESVRWGIPVQPHSLNAWVSHGDIRAFIYSVNWLLLLTIWLASTSFPRCITAVDILHPKSQPRFCSEGSQVSYYFITHQQDSRYFLTRLHASFSSISEALSLKLKYWGEAGGIGDVISCSVSLPLVFPFHWQWPLMRIAGLEDLWVNLQWQVLGHLLP